MSVRSSKRINHEVLAKLEPGEELFPLIGRDRATPITIKLWAHVWLQEIAMGLRPESDRQQITDGLKMADRMERWATSRRRRIEEADSEFDDRGIPTTGPHARKEHNTTSGATDS